MTSDIGMDIDAISHLPLNFNLSGGDPYLWDMVLRDYQQNALYMYKDPFTIVLIILYSIAFIIGFLGNTLVIFVVARHRSMRTLTNTFLVNLAIGDLMVICICVPMTLGRYVYKNWIYGEAMCKLTPFIQGVSVSVSVLTLLAIGLDRYFAITKPMTARLIFSKRKIKFIMTAIWLTSIIMFLPFLVVNSTMRESIMTLEVIHCREHWKDVESKQSYNLIIFLTLYVIPLIILTACYIRTSTILWRGDSTLMKDESNPAQQRALQGRQRVVKMLISIVILFAISWLPYHVINTWMDFEFDGDNRASVSGIAEIGYPISQWLGLANSASNPLCYCFMSRSFRTAFLGAFRCYSQLPANFHSSVRKSTRFPNASCAHDPTLTDKSESPIKDNTTHGFFAKLLNRIPGHRGASYSEAISHDLEKMSCV